jgi:glycosyltransferase involved in cell wall biosynthesis
MVTGRVYYLLKPIIPWRVRMLLRKWRAARKRSAEADVWPINQEASVSPRGWPGWPDGKQFAVILTHDVEGNKGLARVEQLMKLESEHGFRSSFNFVPEGEYRVPASLRSLITQSGFEVGIHGLEHDGKLYSSKAGFAAKAACIRKYAEEWQVSGFRSPLMQHKLAWLHQLGMEYDCSTFDTDPFEPQPDGTATIFPFWVPGLNGNGYVELPYTLPQDFTMFKVLHEPNIDIWKGKVDWIAKHGGMVLLNTHPDYMCFDGEKEKRDEFPVSHYTEFLTYLRDKYEGQFWGALPREVVRYYSAKLVPAERNTRKKICMVTYSNYEIDNRVRRYAEAAAKRGDHVDVIALSSAGALKTRESISGVTVYRVRHRERDEQGKWSYAWRVLRFLLASSRMLRRRHHHLRYDVVHVHNIPDFLVFGAWYPKLTGAKIILDIHDIVPELFASKFDTDDNNRYVTMLKIVEKASAAFADYVIVANDFWYQKLLARSVSKEKCSVYLNHVDTAVFYRRTRTRNDEKFIILFPGSFQWHQGLDIAIKALARIKGKVPNAELHLYGSGGEESQLTDLAKQLGVGKSVKIFGSRPIHEIVDVIANADLGVVPKRADAFGNEAYSTKIMEFMSQGVPVVVARTKIDNFYFNDSVVRFFEPGDDASMAAAMLEVIENRELRESLIAKGSEYAENNSWERRRQDYLNLVDTLSTEVFDSPVELKPVLE